MPYIGIPLKNICLNSLGLENRVVIQDLCGQQGSNNEPPKRLCFFKIVFTYLHYHAVISLIKYFSKLKNEEYYKNYI